MHTTWQQTQWINNKSIKRQFMAFVVSLFLVALLLMIPIQMQYDLLPQQDALEVILSKQQPEIQVKPNSEIVSELKDEETVTLIEVKKPNEKLPKPSVENVNNTTPVIVPPQIEVVRISKAPVLEQPKPLPSSGIIFDSAYGKVHLYELDDDFKARTGNEDDFIFKEIKQPEWNMVTKLIDEDVDKPRVMMNFYSEGIVGSTERFFDKISYKKVFTTRYGTKIACGGIGPLVMCSWK